MLGVVKTRTIHGHCAKKNGTSFSGPVASIAFSISSWLRGVDLNHRPLGYECYCSRNLMDLRGAKSNVTSSLGSLRNCNCPRIALLGAPTSRDGYLALFYAAIQVDCRRR